MKSTLAVCLASLACADVSDEWMDWECPGFPCSVVNYFDGRDHDNYEQACTPLSTMNECRMLIHGENFPADNRDGTVSGWHNTTGNTPHPCVNPYGPCKQPSCLQGSNAKCKALCDRLKLIHPYEDRCYKTCDDSCEDTDENLFACSECTANGHGPDGCNCGYCGSYGGCGWTCGQSSDQAPLGPKCINLPPAPPPHPVPAETTTPGPTPTPSPRPTPSPSPRPSPTPSPTPPGPNPNIPEGGCCSWAGAKEVDECGDSTTWCKATAANCGACDGHWVCPDGPCPAPAPTPIPASGCCSWAKEGQADECGESTSWCKANAGNCGTCNGHWVYPDLV